MEKVGEFTFEPICDKHTEEIKNKSFAPNVSYGDVVVHPSGCVVSENFKNYVEKIRDFEVYPDDVWVLSFPKCGTTWTQEMVWLLVNNLDYKKAKSTPLRTRFPFMELEAVMSKIEDRAVYPSTIDLAANTPRPRCIKSHLPVQLLPKGIWTVKPKVIYVARDPRDAAISYYHHHRLWNAYTGTLEDFTEVFLADRVVYSPVWSHILDYYKIKDEPHVLFNTYEEMKRDLAGVIRKTADFLNISLNDDDVDQLRDHLSFKSMKNNLSCNYMDLGNTIKENLKKVDDDNLDFIRKGESGGWKNVYKNDVLDKFEKWTEKHLQGTGFDQYPWS